MDFKNETLKINLESLSEQKVKNALAADEDALKRMLPQQRLLIRQKKR